MDACALMIPQKVPIYSGYSDQPDHLYYKSIYLIFPGMYNKGEGHFQNFLGVLYLLDFILVGSRGHLIFIWEKGDTLYFILSTHPVFFQIDQIWLKVNFGMVRIVLFVFKYSF